MKIAYDVAICLISNYISNNFSINERGLTKQRFQERSYIRWALIEVLELLYEAYYDTSTLSTNRIMPDVYEIIDSYIFKMKELLSEHYIWAFDVGINAAKQIKLYLKQTNYI